MAQGTKPNTTHPLDDAIEVFKAGAHTDSRGNTTVFTEADLDQMVANHAVQAAPAVIGHPKHNDPAMGWVTSLERKGQSLYAKFKDWNPLFKEAVDAGGYRNRSVSVSKDASKGWQLNHVGFLGAMLPAVQGMAGLAYAAPDNSFEFVAPYETSEHQTAIALETLADMMVSMCENVIADKGVEAADNLFRNWQIDSVRESANRLRKLAQEREESSGNPHLSNPINMKGKSVYSQEDLNRAAEEAATKARTDARAEAQAEFAKQSDETAQELAALKAAQAAQIRTAHIDKWKAAGQLTPAEAVNVAAFMQALDGGATTFTFAKSDDDKKDVNLLDGFVAFMDGRKALVNLGVKSPSQEADVPRTGSEIAKAAQNYMDAEAKKGVTVSLPDAIAHVSQTV